VLWCARPAAVWEQRAAQQLCGCAQVIPCSKRFCHDWTTCPFAHPGEKARRRDPRLYAYTGIACPDMKKARSAHTPKQRCCARLPRGTTGGPGRVVVPAQSLFCQC